ncbi:MAG: CoA transferase, partial [Gordonia polyisoprenivorans]|nr:CoA transferase [Gordonia polyisoprenivorans]
EDTALSIASTLGYLTEPQVNAHSRPATGNDVYGTYGTDVVTADGDRFMLVALTPRHFRDLVRITGTDSVITAIEQALDADFSREADRYTHRAVLNALFGKWFAEHSTDEAATALDGSSVLSQRYRSFDEVVRSGALTDNPLFAELTQTGIGTYLAAGHPASFDGEHYFTGPAARLGEDTPEG